MQGKSKKSNRKTLLKYLLYFFTGLLLLLGSFLLLVFAGAFGKLPDDQSLKDIQNPMATEVYSADGVLMGTYYIENRQYLEPSEIPETIRNALIATEDVRFYEHNGVDLRSLIRVLFKTLLMSQEGSGGGSTLSQQLAKNLYPRGNYGPVSMPVNKVKEMVTAIRMEKIYSKDEILEMYLSTVSFGENTFGIKAASRLYFNQEPRNLQLEQSAVLIGMLKATQTYNPVRNQEQALGRRNVVLNQMSKYGFVDGSVADSLGELPMATDYHPMPHNAGIAPYFREYLRAELDMWCQEHLKNESDQYNLYTDGLKVYTTIDSRLQRYAEEAMQKQMARLQGIFEKQWEGDNLWRGLTEEQLLINYDGEHRSDLSSEGSRKMDVFSWDGAQTKEYNTLDSVKHFLKFLQAGFLAMDVKTAEIKAWVGGINHEHFKYDHVLARRQPGSAFKPLIYLEALEQHISPCDYIPNDSVVYADYQDWTPRNANRKYGGYYSMKGALVHSVNTASVSMLMRVGIDSVLELCEKAGIASPLPAVPSLALGTGAVSLLEMTGIYQAIANRGVSKVPVYLSRIEDRNGNVLEVIEPSVDGTAICTPENAELMIEMLRGVVNEGTAAGLRNTHKITADIAGKTGTTQNYTDGWFMGFTPGLVAGAWVGGDLQNIRFKNMQYGQGAHTAMPIWAGFMKSAFADDYWQVLRSEEFDISEAAKNQLDCEYYRDKKPFRFTPVKTLKEKKFFKNLFRRRNKNE